jgi:hypothetical protein
MAKPALPCSISLGPGHKKRLQQVRERIRTAVQEYPGRSEAIQVALLGFAADAAQIRALVKKNRRHDHRRKSR